MSDLIFYFLSGLILSAVLTWFFSKYIFNQQIIFLRTNLDRKESEYANLIQGKNQWQAEKEILQKSLATAETRILFLDQQYNLFVQLQEDYRGMQSELAVATSNLKNAQEKLENQKEELNNIGAKFKYEFQNLAQSILDEKSLKFTQVNEQKMNDILTPLKTQLGEFKQKVEDTYDKESKERFTLGKEVERLISMTQMVSQEANNLTSALKGNNKMQGCWGEMILESILETSGLAKDREFFLQEFLRDNAGHIIKDEFGKGLQPDCIIVYPDQRKVIIDSKVSLLAWDQSVAESSLDEQKRCLLEHIKSIRQHIDGLCKKNYPRYASALDYVLLFIPIEPAFLEALKMDNTLWKYAYDKKILLVSPTNLFAVLKIIADLWKVEQQNRNAIDIAEKAGSLYDKFAGFIENFELVGKRIAEAGNVFENAQKQLTAGRGNITVKIEELRKMGAKTSKQLPHRLLNDED